TLVTYAQRFVRLRLVEIPLQPEAILREVIRKREAVLLIRQLQGLAQRTRQIAAQRLEPAVAHPLDRFEQRLPSQTAKAVLDAVIHHEPLAVRPFEGRRVASRPPLLLRIDGAHDGVVRAVLPRAVDRSRSRSDDHVTSAGAQ